MLSVIILHINYFSGNIYLSTKSGKFIHPFLWQIFLNTQLNRIEYFEL